MVKIKHGFEIGITPVYFGQKKPPVLLSTKALKCAQEV